jgi:hypothetical protein
MASKRKTLDELAKECSRDLCAQSWWYAPDIQEAFKRGWKAKGKRMKRRALGKTRE